MLNESSLKAKLDEAEIERGERLDRRIEKVVSYSGGKFFAKNTKSAERIQWGYLLHRFLDLEADRLKTIELEQLKEDVKALKEAVGSMTTG